MPLPSPPTNRTADPRFPEHPTAGATMADRLRGTRDPRLRIARKSAVSPPPRPAFRTARWISMIWGCFSGEVALDAHTLDHGGIPYPQCLRKRPERAAEGGSRRPWRVRRRRIAMHRQQESPGHLRPWLKKRGCILFFIRPSTRNAWRQFTFRSTKNSSRPASSIWIPEAERNISSGKTCLRSRLMPSRNLIGRSIS